MIISFFYKDIWMTSYFLLFVVIQKQYCGLCFIIWFKPLPVIVEPRSVIGMTMLLWTVNLQTPSLTDTKRTISVSTRAWCLLQYSFYIIVFINDYHLLLVPEMIREKLPDAAIGIFIHATFPSSEIFRCLQSTYMCIHLLLCKVHEINLFYSSMIT